MTTMRSILESTLCLLTFTAAGSAQFTEFPLKTANSAPIGIARGPDGNLWFTEGIGNAIGSITTSGVITEFAMPTATGNPVALTAAPAGDLGFTGTLGNKTGNA